MAIAEDDIDGCEEQHVDTTVNVVFRSERANGTQVRVLEISEDNYNCIITRDGNPVYTNIGEAKIECIIRAVVSIDYTLSVSWSSEEESFIIEFEEIDNYIDVSERESDGVPVYEGKRGEYRISADYSEHHGDWVVSGMELMDEVENGCVFISERYQFWDMQNESGIVQIARDSARDLNKEVLDD